MWLALDLADGEIFERMDSAVGKASARHDGKRKERIQISLKSVDRWQICCVRKKEYTGYG